MRVEVLVEVGEEVGEEGISSPARTREVVGWLKDLREV